LCNGISDAAIREGVPVLRHDSPLQTACRGLHRVQDAVPVVASAV